MNDLFDRPWLVVETEKKHADCMNPDDIVVTSTHQLFGKGERTKYIDNLLAQLSQSKIKVLFRLYNKVTLKFSLKSQQLIQNPHFICKGVGFKTKN